MWRSVKTEIAIFLLKGLKPETFRDRIEQVNIQDIDPDKLTPEMLDKIAEHLIAKAVGNDRQAIAETRRQLEAGIDPSALVVKTTAVEIGST